MPVRRGLPRNCRHSSGRGGADCESTCALASMSASTPATSVRWCRHSSTARRTAIVTEHWEPGRGTRTGNLFVHQSKKLISIVHKQHSVRGYRCRVDGAAHVHLSQQFLFLAVLHDDDVAVL